MIKLLKRPIFWIGLSCVAWLILNFLNARSLSLDLEAGKFPYDDDSIMIPIMGFAMMSGAILIGFPRSKAGIV